MPKITGQLGTYDMTGKPRDIDSIITMISPEDTPLYTRFKTTDPVTETLSEWQRDTLGDPEDNAEVEGFEVTQFAESNTVELKNRTQIFSKAISVSGSAQASKQVGVSNQYNRQMALRMKEVKLNAEYAILRNGIDVAGTKTTARRMRGLSAWFTTNVNLGAGGAAATSSAPAVAGTKRPLTADMIADGVQAAYTKGGNPKLIMTTPALRRKTSKLLKLVNGQDEKAEGKKVTDTVDVYESDFGILKISPNRVQAKVPYSQDCMFILDVQFWKKAFLTGRNFTEEKLAKTGDSQKGFIVGEFTIQATAEDSSAMIADVQ